MWHMNNYTTTQSWKRDCVVGGADNNTISSIPVIPTATLMEGGAAAADDVTVKAVHKRYEGLLTVKTKAVKGKGAWYWAHLEPILLQEESGLPKAVKLRCTLCDAVFSASNPSRTASEHLKRGTCPNFTSPSSAVPTAADQVTTTNTAAIPITSISPHTAINRKRSSPGGSSYHHQHQHVAPLAIMDATHFSDNIIYSSSSTPPPPTQQQQQQPSQSQSQQQHLVLSGGKEDLGALALLEDSIKKLKSPKASPGPALSKQQSDAAMSLLCDWFYESSGSVSFSSVDHPKFRAFLRCVGMPPIPSRELAGARLDARYDEARCDADARIRDALFFQLASSGWSSRRDDALVGVAVNLPNGTAVFRRALFSNANVPSTYAEDVLWEAVSDVCGSGGGLQRCAGIIADKFKSKALLSLESRNHWMVNLSCQLQGFRSLLKDFARELPIFRSVAANCAKVAAFFNNDPQARSIFHKHLIQEFDHACLLRVSNECDLVSVFAMLEDVIASARPLRMAVQDDSFKLVCLEDPNARELGEMIRDVGFWTDLEAVHSVVVLVNDTVKEMEAERPLIGKCLPLWEELRWKLKDWCCKFGVDKAPVNKLVDKRFKKNYHPAWSAAFILDPLYLTKDASGKYLPPFKHLTPEQEKDVDKLIMRLVSREEAHIVLMELMKWRSEGLDPLYAQAVQVKQLDPATGKMRVANPQSSRLVWETILSEEFKSLPKVAVRLIFLHATSCGFKFNPSLLRWVSRHGRSRAGMDRAHKMIFVAAHAKLDRRDFSNEEEKDVELFANGEDDVLHEGFGDPSSV